MVPTVTPRNKCERSFTHSKNTSDRSDVRTASVMFWISSQVVLITSHISEVMLPRTERALSRADRAHDAMLAGLSGSSVMKCITPAGATSL